MLNSEGFIERGDGPARAVLRANAEKQALRQAIETQEELQKIKDRVCVTLSAYEIGEEICEESKTNVEQIKNAFIKDDAELEFVDDLTKLYLIISDPIAKRKYQQKVTIFVVGYENLCTHRSKLLTQLQDFFTQSSEDDDSFVVETPEFDFEEVGKNVREALNKAEKTTERLANISKEVMKVFELVNPKDHKKGKKKLEKALYQSQQDVLNLTEKLVGVQSDLEDAKDKLNTLTKQLEVKELDIERLKSQVNTNKAFALECHDLKKALEAKEQQLQKYIAQMDEVELALSQAENKYDNYVENNKKLKEENEKLLNEMERKAKEHQQKIIDTRKELEHKYDQQVNELKESQEELVAKLKQSHEEEVKNLREKLDLMRTSTSSKTATTVTTPASRDSAVSRYSSAATDFSQTYSLKSTAKVIKTITDLKGSASSRLDTASSQVSVNKEKDSVLETSSTLFVSMSNTPRPTTPRTANTTPKSIDPSSRDMSGRKKTIEISTQTDVICDDLSVLTDDSEVKSILDLQEIETELSRTPSDELPQKMEEYKNKFMEVQQDLQEEVVQWKLRFNAKAQALNQLYSVHQKEMKEKESVIEQLSIAQEQLAQAEKEAEEAILQLEELHAAKENDPQETEEIISSNQVPTEDRATATSASLSREKELQVQTENRLQSPGDLFHQNSIAIQCPSAHVSRKSSMASLQYGSEGNLQVTDEEDGVIGIQASDSGFGGSSSVLPPKSPDRIDEDSALQDGEKKEFLKPGRSAPPSPRVRSRLVRSALKDHRVIAETIKTYEMVSEFRMNITYWLKENRLEDKSHLLTGLSDVSLDKSDELDVLSKIPLIRDYTRQILDALWQVTRDDFPEADRAFEEFHAEDNGNDRNNDDDGDGDDDDDDDNDDNNNIPTDAISSGDRPLSRSERPKSQRVLLGRSVQTDKLSARHSARTTPRGYTHLLHEYNNLNEEYTKLQQQLQDDLKKYQEETSRNATVMNEMQETINNLKWQLLGSSSSGRNTRQELVSSVMFTRLDAERNVKSMKRALQAKRLSQTSYNNVVRQMNQYIDLPGRRLAELVKRYRHHRYMKEIEENLCPPDMTSDDVYNLQERMENLQRTRAQKWSEKMAELGKQRSKLGGEITSSLNEIEESSGIFLIKPVYSYSSRSKEVGKSSHPIICKKRQESPRKPSVVPSEGVKKPVHPADSSPVTVFSVREDGRPMWNLKESHVSGPVTTYDNIPIPRLLAMDVNRITLNRNPVSEYINQKSGDPFALAGVRQYVTVERPIGVMSKPQLNGESAVLAPCEPLPVQSRTTSPSMSHYATLPPINLPNMAGKHVTYATSASTHQSASSISTTSFDDIL